MMKPTYEELERRLTASETDNRKAMESLKKADVAVKLALSKFIAMTAEVSAVFTASEQVYAAGYQAGHLNTADGIAYEKGTREEFCDRALEVLLANIETPEINKFIGGIKAQAITNALNNSSDYLDTDCVMDRLDISYMDAELRTTGATELHDALIAVANQLRQGAGQ